MTAVRPARRHPRIAGLAVTIGAMGALTFASACHTVSGSRVPLIQSPSTCADTTISIYFEPRSAAITHPAANLLDAAAAAARRCAVSGIDVKGLADAVGSPDANFELSRRRADAVTLALHRRGFDKVAFDVSASGGAGAQNGYGEARPLRRRADVTFHLSPKP
ncbi:MAG: OmpA family protein [Caulobacteraceae bacterium]